MQDYQRKNVWQQASPAFHVAPNKMIPAFVILSPAGDEAIKIQSMSFAKKLNDAKVEAMVVPQSESSTGSLDANIGNESDLPTLALMAFLNAKL